MKEIKRTDSVCPICARYQWKQETSREEVSIEE